MKIIPYFAALSFSSLFAVSGCVAVEDAHKKHHPDAATSTQKANSSSMPAINHELMIDKTMNDMAMDSQMKTMRDIHEKMMRATSTDERKKLMAEHMKAMQAGMKMMNDMKEVMKCDMDSGMESKHQMMEKRMQMMETMMQMMMDRMMNDDYDEHQSSVKK